MWLINSSCRDRSTTDKRTLNIQYHIAGNNGDGAFTTLAPHEWYPDTLDNEHILIEFECINEIKNLRDNLNLILEEYNKKRK